MIVKVWKTLKACFFRETEKNEHRSTYCNEEVSKVPKDKMMERIADIIRGEQGKKSSDADDG
jgi:uncharacterized protein with PIN domain